jgi:hypothetical protein
LPRPQSLFPFFPPHPPASRLCSFGND